MEHHNSTDYTTSYEYTRSGQLKYIHDSAENDTHYSYNWAGELITTEPGSTGRILMSVSG